MPLTAALLLASVAALSPYAEECAEIARLDAAANALLMDVSVRRALAGEAVDAWKVYEALFSAAGSMELLEEAKAAAQRVIDLPSVRNNAFLAAALARYQAKFDSIAMN